MYAKRCKLYDYERGLESLWRYVYSTNISTRVFVSFGGSPPLPRRPLPRRSPAKLIDDIPAFQTNSLLSVRFPFFLSSDHSTALLSGWFRRDALKAALLSVYLARWGVRGPPGGMEGTQKTQIARTGGSSRICPLIFVLRMVKWVFKFGNVSAEPRSTSRIYLGKCRVVSLSHSLLSRNGWHCLRPPPMRVAFLVDFFAFHTTRTTERKRKGEREREREEERESASCLVKKLRFVAICCST